MGCELYFQNSSTLFNSSKLNFSTLKNSYPLILKKMHSAVVSLLREGVTKLFQ